METLTEKNLEERTGVIREEMKNIWDLRMYGNIARNLWDEGRHRVKEKIKELHTQYPDSIATTNLKDTYNRNFKYHQI